MKTSCLGQTHLRATPRHILVFSIGSLGDTLLVVPALHALRAEFPDSHIVLLSDVQAGTNYVLSKQVVDNSGLIDETLDYPVHEGRFGSLVNLLSKVRVLVQLRRKKFDTLAYFVEAYSGDRRVKRDRLFFRLAGIQRFIGMDGFEQRPQSRGLEIERVNNRADELLARLGASGVTVPPIGQGRVDLNLRGEESGDFERWRNPLPSDGGRLWIGIGPGSKMPAKLWPAGRYEALVQRLINEFDCWPVVFGGREDVALGKQLVSSWRRGYVAAGELSIRTAAVGLERCMLYVGNDSGTMHLAAAVQTPCVAIFSSRAPRGRWAPYGSQHKVLRANIECAGCGLTVCVERANACLREISVDDAYHACRELLHSKAARYTG